MENVKSGKKIETLMIQHSDMGSRKANKLYVEKQILSNADCDLVVMPELNMSEYFCQQKDDRKFDYANYFTEDIEYFSYLSERYNCVIIASLFEKINSLTGGTYYNSVVVLDKGRLAGKIRKAHIPQDENEYIESYFFTPGSDIVDTLRPITTSIGKLGIIICFTAWFPEAYRTLALQGAELFIVTSSIGWNTSDTDYLKQKELSAWQTVQKGNAIANLTPLISVNRVGREGAIDFWGNSFACDSFGEVVCELDEKVGIKIINIELGGFNKKYPLNKVWTFSETRQPNLYGKVCNTYK